MKNQKSLHHITALLIFSLIISSPTISFSGDYSSTMNIQDAKGEVQGTGVRLLTGGSGGGSAGQAGSSINITGSTEDHQSPLKIHFQHIKDNNMFQLPVCKVEDVAQEDEDREKVRLALYDPSTLGTELEQWLKNIFPSADGKIDGTALLDGTLKKCENLKEFFTHSSLDIVAKGKGHKSDAIKADNPTFRNCMSLYKVNLQTPGHYVKELVKNTKAFDETKVSGFQTKYYQVVMDEINRIEEIRTKGVVSPAEAATNGNLKLGESKWKLEGAEKALEQNLHEFKAQIAAMIMNNCQARDDYNFNYESNLDNFPKAMSGFLADGTKLNLAEVGDKIVLQMNIKSAIAYHKHREKIVQDKIRSNPELTKARESLAVCLNGPDSNKFWRQRFEEANRQIGECAALSVITTRFREFSRTSDFNQPEPDKTSMDGKLTCKDIGATGQDFDRCLASIIAYDVGLAEEKLSEEVYRKDVQVIKTTELAAQDPTDPAAALRSQVKVLERTLKHYEWKIAAEGAKAITLTTTSLIHNSIDAKQGCIEELQDKLRNSGFDDNGLMSLVFPNNSYTKLREIFFGAGGDQTWTTNLDAGQMCESAMMGVVLYPNKPMAGKAGVLAINATANAIAFGVSRDQIQEAITTLNKLIAEIDNAVEGTLPENPFADLKQNPCFADPTLDGCFTDEGVGGFNASLGDISLSDPEFGLSGSETVNSDTLDENNAVGDNASTASNLNTKNKISGVSDSVSRAKGVQDKVAAGQLKTAPVSAPGGGGGGGGGSAPNVGGGGGRRGGQGQGGPGYQAKKYDLSTGGKGGTRAIFSGGSGLGGSSGRKANRDKNPFAKLAGGKSVDKFRNPSSIGKKGASIWDTITKRYTDVDKKGRLEKYEAK